MFADRAGWKLMIGFRVLSVWVGLLGVQLGWGQEMPPPPVASPAPASAADEGPVTTLKLATRVVNVPALVRDGKGSVVRGLTKEDFLLKEDGKVQEIRYFSQDSALPLTIALLIDTSGSQTGFIPDEIRASDVFFKTMLKRPEDRASLIQFDTTILRLRRMTNSVPDLEASLSLLSTDHAPSRQNLSQGGTLLYDAISSVSYGILGKEPGRHAMVLLTDGDDNGSRYTLQHAVSDALIADATVYSIFYSAREGFGGGEGKRALEVLSRSTGGRVFEVSKKETLEVIYGEIADDLRLQYQIGFRPADAVKGSYHHLELGTVGKKLKVQAREGYFTLQ